MDHPDALIVYHEAGVPGSESILGALAERLRELGFEVQLAPLRDALSSCPRAGRVYLLMFARGGHWLSLLEACGKPPLHIPAWIAAAGLARAAGWEGSIALLYRRARRLVDVYSADVASIAAALRATGLRVYPVEASLADRSCLAVDVVAPLALLPGRLSALAERLAERLGARPVAPFALHSLDLLAAWIASTLLEEDDGHHLVASKLAAGEELKPRGLG